MKGIFKQVSIILTGLIILHAEADEGEIYSVSLDGKPQVLIILDTSSHMREEADFPYPKYYDPHIAYPPIPDTNAEDLIYRWFYGGEQFYYNRDQEARELDHSALLRISEKAVKSYAGGSALTSVEEDIYDDFVATIPDLNSDPNIDFSYMNCYSALEDFQGALGAYQDYIAQWLPNGREWGDGIIGEQYLWKNIGSRSSIGKKFVDCQHDITAGEARNPGYEHSAIIQPSDISDGETDGYQEKESRQGFPTDGPQYYWNSYQDNAVRNLPESDDNKAYLYSDNLVKWAKLEPDTSGNIRLSNLQIAKKVVLDLMLDTTEINTGLEIFNPNNSISAIDILNNNGGRVISGVSSYDPADYDSTTAYRSKVSLLKSKVKDIFTTGYSKSALCESLYEGYRYLYGKGVWYGDDVLSGTKPQRDESIEDGDSYISPMDWVNSCQTEAYIIMLTTGHHDVSPRIGDIVPCGGIFNDAIRIDAFDHDSKANKLIEQLPGMAAQDIQDKAVQVNDADTTCDKNLLPVLSGWLANNDMNATTPDVKERIVTYTVGIGNLDSRRRNLLEKTAEYGDGEFYNALNANELRQKLEMAFADIISRQQGVTAAVGTSINSSNSTKSNEFVYYTMFQPNQTSKWQGNIRKLKVTDDGQLSAWTQSARVASSLTSATSAALSTSNSIFFNDDLYSAWSSEQGLNDADLGGVVEALKNRELARNIYISNIDDSILLPLTKANLKLAFAVGTDADLANVIGVSEGTLVAAIDWLQGLDEAGDFRDDIFGDPMHVQPLIVEYPDTESADITTKARIFIGTNAGFFHAFKDNGRSVEEEWAFIPKENIATALQLNLQVTKAENRIYGIDGSAVDASYLDSTGNIKHIITFGLRRGGSKYFSLNVNLDLVDGNTTKPELNWVIDADKTGFSALTQTWSTPVVSKIFRGDDSTNDKPVLIFGAGYDESKDDCGSNSTTIPAEGCADAKGRAVYIVDADSGRLIKSFDYGISDSIASELAVMDSDGDGYADRIYAPDTAGNIYRVDMPTPNTKKVDMLKWRLFKLANLGGTGADDRRFFSAPSIVRAREGDSSYDGLLLGSGDITSPNSNITAQNYFFNIKDTNIYPQVWGDDKDAGEREVPAAIVLNDLDKITYNSSTEKDKLKPNDDSDALYGWHYTLNEATVTKEGVTTRGGEKSLGNAVVINGIVHFNTYTPFAHDYVIENDQCVVNQSGNSNYYQVALNSGSTKYYQKLPNVIAKDLAVHAASNGGASILRILGASKGDTADIEGVQAPTGTIDTDVTLSPRPIYRYFNEAVQ